MDLETTGSSIGTGVDTSADPNPHQSISSTPPARPHYSPPETHLSEVPTRWICWPKPDRICLVGDCPKCLSAPHTRITRNQVAYLANRLRTRLKTTDIDKGMRMRAAEPVKAIAERIKRVTR